jgi:hypothetical protein
MKTRLIPAVLGLMCAPLASAAFVQVWQIGVDDDGQAEFAQESGGLEAAPGSAAAKDDDYYLAGTYPAPIGVVTTNEDTVQFMERALTGNAAGAGDSADRFHFNLDGSQAAGTNELRVTVDLIGLGYWDASEAAGGAGTTVHDLSVSLNGVNIGSQAGIGGPTTWVLNTTAAAVNATAGANVLEITRTGGLSGDDPVANTGWIQYDFLRLEAQPIPEPSTTLLFAAMVGGAVMTRRRRRL